MKIPLFHALQNHVTASHTSLIDEYSLVLRVDGALHQYGEEGLARLRLAKAQRYITVDIQIPKHVWEPLSDAELRAYIARQTEAAIDACLARIKRESEVDAQLLISQVHSAVKEYLA